MITNAIISPYLRTRQSAEGLFNGMGYIPEVTIEERIREIEFGILDGFGPEGMKIHFPEEVARRKVQGKYWYRPPGGESRPDVRLRCHSFLGTLTRDYAAAGYKWPDELILVRHGQTEANVRKAAAKASGKEPDYSGSLRDQDTPLTELGRAQMHAAGVHLSVRYPVFYNDYRVVLVISHSVVVMAFRSLLERWGEQEYMQVDREDDIKNGSITTYRLNRSSGKLELIEFNFTPEVETPCVTSQ